MIAADQTISSRRQSHRRVSPGKKSLSIPHSAISVLSLSSLLQERMQLLRNYPPMKKSQAVSFMNITIKC